MAREREDNKARAIWTGAISFGLVNVPVRLYTATATHDIGFHQFDSKTKKRVEYKRVAGDGGREVPYEQIVKGYEVSKGKIVLILPEELEALEPKRSRTIELEQFAELREIDPIVWDATYYLGPDERAGGEKTYELLRRALEDTGRFVMRTREYLATVRPLGPGLVLETMLYADELRPQKAAGVPVKAAVAPKELTLAKQLVESMTAPFDHAQFKDTYRDRVLDLIKRKGRGEEIETEVPEDEPAEVIDLMEALKASLGSGKKRAAKATPHTARKRRAS